MLLTFDYSGEIDRRSELRMDAANAALQPVSMIDPNAPVYAFTNYNQNPGLYNSPQLDTWDQVHDYGLFLNEHASMFDNRLNLIAGIRLDWINTKLDDYSIYNYSTGAFSSGSFTAAIHHHASHQLGLSYRVTNPVTVFVNQSTSIDPQANYIPGSGSISPNSSSKGYEFGAKVSLIQNSLNFTVDHYDISQYNAFYQISTSEILPSGQTASVTSYMNIPLQVSRGYEFDLDWQATKSLELGVDYSYDECTIRQATAQYLYLQGDPTRRVPQDQFGAYAHYHIEEGILKGLFFVAGTHYYSKSVVNISGGRAATGTGFLNNPNPNGTLPWGNAVPAGAAVPANLTTRTTPATVAAGTATVPDPQIVHLPDGREGIYNAPWSTTDVGIGYDFKTGRFGHKLQFNVKNVFNRQYTYGSGIAGDPITYIGTYTFTF
jgi:outer membrane receptor protein involved in Fe transport